MHITQLSNITKLFNSHKILQCFYSTSPSWGGNASFWLLLSTSSISIFGIVCVWSLFCVYFTRERARAFCCFLLMRDFVFEKNTSICVSTSFSTVVMICLPALVKVISALSWCDCAAPVCYRKSHSCNRCTVKVKKGSHNIG